MRPLLIGLVIAVGFAPQLPGLAQTPVQVPVQAPTQAPAPAPAPTPALPKVQLTFEPGGLVTLVASDVSVRDVLAEWTRKGGTPFVGAERLTGSPLTVQFQHRPETEVVSSLLRGASGVVMAARAPGSIGGASTLEVVYIVATSNATMGGYQAPTYTAPQPQVSTPGSPDQEIAPVGPGRSGQPPQDVPPPAARPAGVGGVAVPVVPVVPVASPPTTTTGGGRGGGGGGRR